MPGMLQPGLVWRGLAVLPRGPPKPPSTARAQPILNMIRYCVVGQSHVQQHAYNRPTDICVCSRHPMIQNKPYTRCEYKQMRILT
jgi:hypothetical protein